MGDVATLGLRLDGSQLKGEAASSAAALKQLGITGEDTANKLSASIKRMQQTASANSLASQIAAQDPFQKFGQGATDAAVPMRAFNETVKATALSSGAMGREAFILSNAIGELTKGMSSAGGVSKAFSGILSALNPITITLIAAFAAYEVVLHLVEKATEESIKKSEELGAVADAQTARLRVQNEVHAENAHALALVQAELRAFTAGGEAALHSIQDQEKAFEAAKAQWLKTPGALKSVSDETLRLDDRFKGLYQTQLRIVGGSRALVDAQAQTAAASERVRQRMKAEDEEWNAQAKYVEDTHEALAKYVEETKAFLRPLDETQQALKKARDQYDELAARLRASGIDIKQITDLYGAMAAKIEIAGLAADIAAVKVAKFKPSTSTPNDPKGAATAAKQMEDAFTQSFANIAARGKASFGDLFNFIKSSGIGGAGASGTFSLLAIAGEAFTGIFQQIADASARWRAAVKAFNDDLDSWSASIAHADDTFAQGMDTINQHARDLQRQLDATFAPTSGFTVGFGGTQALQFEQQLHSAELARQTEAQQRLNKTVQEATDALIRQRDAQQALITDSIVDRIYAALGDIGDKSAAATLLQRQRDAELKAAQNDSDRALLRLLYMYQDLKTAADDAADATRQAADALRQMQDVQVEILRAQGDTAGADQLQRDIDRAARIQAAAGNQSLIDQINKLYDLLDANAHGTGPVPVAGTGPQISRVSTLASATFSQFDLSIAYLATISARVARIERTNDLLEAMNNGGVVISRRLSADIARTSQAQGNGVVS